MALRSSLAATSLPIPLSGRRRVVGDHRQVAFVLPHDLVDEALRRAHAHEPADHQARAVGDHGNRLFAEIVCMFTSNCL